MLFTSLSAAVLAGGKAERMSGQDKGLLLYSGEPMALCVGRALRQVSDTVWINANRNMTSYSQLGFDVVMDQVGCQGYGPLSGIMTCLQKADTSHLLISPCDTPRISCAALVALQQACECSPEVIHYLHSVSGPHPLHAILPVESALVALQAFLLTQKRYRVMGFYELVGSQAVEWAKDDELLNVNTPNELI